MPHGLRVLRHRLAPGRASAWVSSYRSTVPDRSRSRRGGRNHFRGTGIPDSRYIMRFGKPGGQVHDATSFRDIAIGQERYLGSRLASGSNSCVGSRTGN